MAVGADRACCPSCSERIDVVHDSGLTQQDLPNDVSRLDVFCENRGGPDTAGGQRVTEFGLIELDAHDDGNTPDLQRRLSRSSGVSHSGELWDSGNHQKGQSESGYWLLDPAEVQRLPLTRTIVKLRNVPYSILGRRLDYRKVRRGRGQWDRWRGASVKRSRFRG